MKLGVLGQRYRLIKISNEPPRFREDTLGPNLVTSGPAELTNSWTSADIKLDSTATYVLSAKVKIDKAIGEESPTPNKSVGVSHFLSIQLTGEGINGVNATNALALCAIKGTSDRLPYRDTSHYQQSYSPRHWEKTPGWMNLFLPVGTATNSVSGRVVVGVSDPGQAQIKDITLRKVK